MPPVRSDIAGETRNALKGQRIIIGMMADYKGWKINQENNGADISILNEGDRESYINAASSNKQKRYRKAAAGILRIMEEQRTAE